MGEKKEDTRLRSNDAIGDSRNLTGDERGIVESACEALEKKRQYFETLFDGDLKFTFEVSEKACGSTSYSFADTFEASLIGVNTGNYMLSTGYRSSYFNDELTDENGMTGVLCRSFFAGDKLENIIEEGGYKYKFRVLRQNQYDIVEVARYAKDSTPNMIEQAYVVNEKVSQKDTVGFIYQRARSTPCSGGGQRALKQILKSARI